MQETEEAFYNNVNKTKLQHKNKVYFLMLGKIAYRKFKHNVYLQLELSKYFYVKIVVSLVVNELVLKIHCHIFYFSINKLCFVEKYLKIYRT